MNIYCSLLGVFSFFVSGSHIHAYIQPRVLTVVGGQFGDEGKGKIIDYLASKADFVVRAQGGNNAGHTVTVGNTVYKFHMIPSGILYPSCQCVVGAGVVIDPLGFDKEVQSLQEQHGIDVHGRLWVSHCAHIIMPYHSLLDKLQEKAKGAAAIGTTGRGIGPCYTDKTNRIGIRVADLFDEQHLAKRLAAIVPFVNNHITMLKNAIGALNTPDNPAIPSAVSSQLVDLTTFDALITTQELRAYCVRCADILRPFIRSDIENILYKARHTTRGIILEGAQGTFLDVTFGMVPFVTSSSTIAAGICGGAGFGPTSVDTTMLVIKAYTTRVGNGPFPTEVLDDAVFMKVAGEKGTLTGRSRRVGWFDAVLVKKAVMINGADCIALTKLDILDSLETIKLCVAYACNGVAYDELPYNFSDFQQLTPVYEEMPGWLTSTRNIRTFDELPENARRYCNRISQLCGAPLAIISVGPERTQTIMVA